MFDSSASILQRVKSLCCIFEFQTNVGRSIREILSAKENVSVYTESACSIFIKYRNIWIESLDLSDESRQYQNFHKIKQTSNRSKRMYTTNSLFLFWWRIREWNLSGDMSRGAGKRVKQAGRWWRSVQRWRRWGRQRVVDVGGTTQVAVAPRRESWRLRTLSSQKLSHTIALMSGGWGVCSGM
jgi:hypothetical protein